MREGSKCPVCKSGRIYKQDDLEFEDLDIITGKTTIKKYPDGTFACDNCCWVDED